MKKWIFILSMMLMIAPHAHARSGGTEGGNGGDMCEDHIQMIRNEISSWIREGGATALQFPAGLTLADYKSKMLKAMSQADISCTDQPVIVQGANKACKNFVALGRPQILCNRKDFMFLTEDQDKIPLIHHEYAGLAGIEINTTDQSQYGLTNQLVNYIQGDQLLVNPVPETDTGKIQITMVPVSPVVVTADFDILDPLASTPSQPVYKTIKAPWFKFSYGLTNGNAASSSPILNSVTVETITLTVLGTNTLGQSVWMTQSLSALNASGYDPSSSPPYLASVLPGRTIRAGTNSSGSFDGTNYAGDFFAFGLPDLIGNSQTCGVNTSATPSPILSTYHYHVIATFTGWFGLYDQPSKRFKLVKEFDTQ